MKVFLDDTFAGLWCGRDPFAEVERLEGEVFRHVKNRRTLKFSLDGKNWFLKHHRGAGWGEIIKNLVNFKRPVISARNEYAAILRLGELGVETMRCAAFGARGWNPAKIESFIITAEIPDAVSLEDLAKRPVPFGQKTGLIRRVAKISRILHDHGINHRDYYLCHFLLSGGELHLIDLHRVQIRRRIPRHYLFKDMGGLWFSAMDADLSRADCLRFIAAYSGRPLREELAANAGFWRKIDAVAEKLYRREHRRNPSHCFKEYGK
ncbi:MAG: lipopolysaccharide core heptose(I) kinase RfaP [Victivallaceae bacterium]|nr:lipopolysaccharide core heptose(I) kinase RfaP [Victivallaceae bacterium]